MWFPSRPGAQGDKEPRDAPGSLGVYMLFPKPHAAEQIVFQPELVI